MAPFTASAADDIAATRAGHPVQEAMSFVFFTFITFAEHLSIFKKLS